MASVDISLKQEDKSEQNQKVEPPKTLLAGDSFAAHYLPIQLIKGVNFPHSGRLLMLIYAFAVSFT